MEIDVRGPGGFDVTSIRYSGSMSLMGSPSTDNITAHNNDTGQQLVVCKKAEIDDLIEALQAVKKFWF